MSAPRKIRLRSDVIDDSWNKSLEKLFFYFERADGMISGMSIVLIIIFIFLKPHEKSFFSSFSLLSRRRRLSMIHPICNFSAVELLFFFRPFLPHFLFLYRASLTVSMSFNESRCWTARLWLPLIWFTWSCELRAAPIAARSRWVCRKIA